ncbi:MAG: cobalamin biosynthesis protein P47K [Pirellulales bacterium]|nr:cobalamin biosynthesis protein P47K [Pirellulales bacterium]
MQFILLGGFLGAGKTTTIARIAATYQQQGRKVGIVTNDQAADLVDTHTLRSQGFDVGEVAGACFCCNFNELTDVVANLESEQQPDVILAEPVGSCTDLAATVIQPIVRLLGEKFEVAPYGVILKPSHGLRILRDRDGGGFSPKAAYIFDKQLEEADFVIINRIDQLAKTEVDDLERLIQERHPDVPVLRTSAKSGEGFDALLEMLARKGAFGRRILDIDYDVYAEGEAELGWLNSNFHVTSESTFDLDQLLQEIVGRMKSDLAAEKAETAHLKVIGLWEGFYGVANLTSSDTPAELSLPSHCQTKEADLVVNARVAIDPQRLEQLGAAAVNAAAKSQGAVAQEKVARSLRPGRPVPTHRFAEPL